MKYLLVDTSNMFFRARHVAAKGTDSWSKLGLSLHLTFSSLLTTWRLFRPDHVIFCLEGRSWRKTHTPSYKRNRVDALEAMTEAEQEENQLFYDTYNKLTEWLNEYTNSTVAQVSCAEADDLIARWIHLHPQDEHIICSTDSDFHQLLGPNVMMYNGVAEQVVTTEGFSSPAFDAIKFSKTKFGLKHRAMEDPKWILFEKCMRGDPTDNVMSAYPGVRKKGSSKKVGLLEAFADKDKQGYAWNNMMLQRWTDHEGNEHRVLDRYEENKTLIDLAAQPNDVKLEIDQYLLDLPVKDKAMVGAYFLKFCGKYELERLSQNAQSIAEILSQKLPKE